MGFWKTERGRGGDSWADELGNCMHKLSGLKAKGDDGTGYEITMQEFADLVEFCSRGHIITEIRYPEDGQRPLSQLKEVETYPNRGQIHCPETVVNSLNWQGATLVDVGSRPKR